MLQYIKHVVFNTAKRGWNVVVSNHRGLGGVSVTVSGFLVDKFRAIIEIGGYQNS